MQVNAGNRYKMNGIHQFHKQSFSKYIGSSLFYSSVFFLHMYAQAACVSVYMIMRLAPILLFGRC